MYVKVSYHGVPSRAIKVASVFTSNVCRVRLTLIYPILVELNVEREDESEIYLPFLNLLFTQNGELIYIKNANVNSNWWYHRVIDFVVA